MKVFFCLKTLILLELSLDLMHRPTRLVQYHKHIMMYDDKKKLGQKTLFITLILCWPAENYHINTWTMIFKLNDKII
jgi:hypothetical protein